MNVPKDNDCLTTSNFDMELLTSMANTDLLIRLIKDQAQETSALKNQLSSFNTSAMQIKNCYTLEKKRNDQLQEEIRQLQLQLQGSEEKISLLNDNLINNTAINEQIVAGLENQLADKSTLCKQLIIQGRIIKANDLGSSKECDHQCKKAEEWLKSRGETIEDVIISEKKKLAKVNVDELQKSKTFCKKKLAKVNVGTSTDELQNIKTFCNQSTMHCPVVSTATRGTSTSTFIKNVDVATNFPEPISIEEIFRLTILEMPPCIEPIGDLPLVSKYVQTSPQSKSSCSTGTMTRIKNVRCKLSYGTDQPQLSPTSDVPYHVKKEKEDPMWNLEFANQRNLPINRKLTNLWQMVGQMIFSIIGNGQVFSNSNDWSLISDNLNQIRRVIELESQPEQFGNMDAFVDGPLEDLPGFGPCTAIVHNSSSENSCVGNMSSSSLSPDLHHFESASTVNETHQQIEPITPIILPKTPKQSSTETSSVSSLNEINTECDIDHVFKVPTVGAKRKLISGSESSKRTCRTKRTVKSTVCHVDQSNNKLTKSESCNTSEHHSPVEDYVQQLTSPIDEESDNFTVDEILPYFKLPEFIEPIVDSEFVIRANDRTVEVDELTINENDNCEAQSTESPMYDEFESPASPSPNDSVSSCRPPTIIPLSPKKSNSSIIKSILDNFDHHKRRSISQRKNPNVFNEDEEHIVITTRNIIESYLISEWNVNSVDICLNDLSNTCPSLLSKSIIEIIMNTRYENPSREFTPPAPVLPKSHQKIVVLIKRITHHLKRFEDLVLFQLEKALFVLSRETVSKNEAINLTYLFIGLTDSINEPSKWSCVRFIYKCLYYFSFKAIPMVYSVLMAYPTLIPKFQEGEDVTNFLTTNTNVLQSTFIIILMNTNLYELSDSGLKKKELSLFLKSYYHFPLTKPTTEVFIDNLINRLNCGTSNLLNISYSLILIAKRQGTVWADEFTQRKLLPLLNKYLVTIADGPENDERITILVSTISSIVKTYPVTKDISNYQQIFVKLLDLTTRQAIQEAAVMGLLRTSRFGVVDVYQRICDWEPSFAVSRKLYFMLNSFIYRQNLSYWRQF